VQCKGEYGSGAPRPPLWIPSMAYTVAVSYYARPAVNRHRLRVAVSFRVCKRILTISTNRERCSSVAFANWSTARTITVAVEGDTKGESAASEHSPPLHCTNKFSLNKILSENARLSFLNMKPHMGVFLFHKLTALPDHPQNTSPKGGIHMDSPGIMIVRRFFRSRLATAGLAVILFMAVFSFILPYFMPYGETQQFTRTVNESRTAASAAFSDGYNVYTADNAGFGSADIAAFMTAYASGNEHFESGGTVYTIVDIGECILLHTDELDTAVLLTEYTVTLYNGYDFGKLTGIMRAFARGETAYGSYTFDQNEYGADILLDSLPAGEISLLNVTAVSGDHGFIRAVRRAVIDGTPEFSHDGTVYTVTESNGEYTVSSNTAVTLLDTYAKPSKAHPLGTDGNGMDILTRLMYGGRVSLTVGFTVILAETAVGVVLGGIAGYFGGICDTVIMRILDTVSCIPTTPLYLILGSVMSTLRISQSARIYLMMLMLSLVGWTGMARITRGQVLSIREHEFMSAAEALGLGPFRRIFRHLLPNAIPQVIVYAAMSLGSVILTEAVLSFLNLGIRYPYASWGNIVNAVTDVHVLTSYPFVWIPAGTLILVTVLAFNLIGDGLRDAVDPKS